MSEITMNADSANALSGLTDPDLDITYPAIGETPYHTTMYRLLHRMAAVVKVVNQFRVYKDGDLTFGVRGGVASRGANQYSFSGAESQSLSDDATNYIYLTISGSELVLNVSTSSMPDAATVPHIPLCRIDTGLESLAAESGAYSSDDIVDLRGAAMVRVIGS